MEKNQKAIGIAVIALLFSIMGIGVAFSALSQDLTINGAATFDPASWAVKFDTTSLSQTVTGKATATTPTITATTIGTYAVTLSAPGDSVDYTFTVKNEGTLDAIISVLTKSSPTCTGTGTNATTDASLVCDNLVYTLTYNTVGGTAVAVNDELDASASKTMVLHIEYPSTMTTVPDDDVSITIPTLTITYVQD